MRTCSRSFSILSLLGGFLIAQGTALAVAFAASGPPTSAAQTVGFQAPAPVLNRVSLGLYLNPFELAR
jgi:hypothetical protein